MAKKAKSKKCRVSFYEVVKQPDEARFTPLNWQVELAKLGDNARTHGIGGKTVRGQVFRHGVNRHLVLDSERELLPRQRNRTTNERAPLGTNGADWEGMEETFIAFFDRNIIGIARSGNGAPSHPAIAGWLNQSLHPAERYFLRPVVSRDRYQRLSEMKGVSVATFGLKPVNSGRPNSSFLQSLTDLSEGIGRDLRLEIKVVAGRRDGKPENAALLAQTLEVLADIQGDDSHAGVDKAIVNGIPKDGSRIEPISLIEQNLTMQQDIPLSTTAGSTSLDENAAIDAIAAAEAHLRDDLYAAIGVPLT